MLTCGPEILMRFTVTEALHRRVSDRDIYYSMERNMQCAVGCAATASSGRRSSARTVRSSRTASWLRSFDQELSADRRTVLKSPESHDNHDHATKPRLGVFKFASCDGCQLSLLDCEDELLAVADRVEIAYFLEATRRPLEGEFDVALVEGSVSTPGQEEEIRDIRRRSRFLITLGACASHGGIQGLRNFGSLNVDQALAIVYASPQYVETLGLLAAGQRLRARRPGAAGLPDQQESAPRRPGPDAGRQPAQGTEPCALPGLQASAPGVHPGGPGRPVHGAGHVHRLRGALPELRSPVL